jgi:superfamily II DNA/RNA helicase
MRKKLIFTKLVVSKEKDKIETLFTLICSLKSQSAIVFATTETLQSASVTLYSTYYHGGMDQDERACFSNLETEV